MKNFPLKFFLVWRMHWVAASYCMRSRKSSCHINVIIVIWHVWQMFFWFPKYIYICDKVFKRMDQGLSVRNWTFSFMCRIVKWQHKFICINCLNTNGWYVTSNAQYFAQRKIYQLLLGLSLCHVTPFQLYHCSQIYGNHHYQTFHKFLFLENCWLVSSSSHSIKKCTKDILFPGFRKNLAYWFGLFCSRLLIS